ncbi:lipase, partial [Campylobacter coli]|nr:lipase [Campylobacter coli]
WYKFNFVQNLHSKIGYPIWLNIGNKFHHPKICPKILHKVLNML